MCCEKAVLLSKDEGIARSAAYLHMSGLVILLSMNHSSWPCGRLMMKQQAAQAGAGAAD